MINSQPPDEPVAASDSISKGMGDQFSASVREGDADDQYIKGDG